MSGRRLLALLLLLPLLLATSARPSRAEDEEPPAPDAKGGEEKGGEAKGEPKKGDTIFKDWKEVKKKGIAYAKERAEHWEATGVKGKDLVWLGLMWDRAQNAAKAAKALEESLSAPDITDKNKELARWNLILVSGKARDWAKMASAAETFRAEHATSGTAAGTWVEEGRARRMLGEKDKAIAAFEKGAENTQLTAILELLDLHLAEGDVDAASKVLTTYADVDIKGKETYFAYWKDFLSLVGKDAPSLAEAKVVKGAAPTKGKPVVLYYWHMQITAPEGKLGQVSKFASAYGDRVQVAAVGTFNKYNPDTTKKEEGMTEDQELDWYKQFGEKIIGRSMPDAIVVPKETIEGLKMKFEGTKVVLDKDGKYRYARTFENAPYGWDWTAVELATKKLLGS